MSKKLKYGIAVLVLLALLLFILKTLYQAGSFKKITPHFEGSEMSFITGIPGPEDLEIDREEGLMYISSTDRWSALEGVKTNGGIYIMNLKEQDPPKPMWTDFTKQFNPHGISFLEHGNTKYLFVVNHNWEGDYVESFEIRNDSLFHLKTFSDDMLCCPNDVLAVDADKFYVTNDHGNKDGLKRTLEDYLQIPQSYLMYYNGEEFSVVFDKLKYANGINASSDGKTIYLTHTIGRQLLTLDRNKSSGELSLISKTNLNSGVDNIDVDNEGNIWIASHPKMLSFAGHATDRNKISPSQVLKLTPKPERGEYEVREVFLDDGSKLSGSSVAVVHKNQMYVGVVFQEKILKGKLGN